MGNSEEYSEEYKSEATRDRRGEQSLRPQPAKNHPFQTPTLLDVTYLDAGWPTRNLGLANLRHMIKQDKPSELGECMQNDS